MKAVTALAWSKVEVSHIRSEPVVFVRRNYVPLVVGSSLASHAGLGSLGKQGGSGMSRAKAERPALVCRRGEWRCDKKKRRLRQHQAPLSAAASLEKHSRAVGSGTCATQRLAR
jgi:hypothetical protein